MSTDFVRIFMLNKKHVFCYCLYLKCLQLPSKTDLLCKKKQFWSKIGPFQKIFFNSIMDNLNQNMFEQKILIKFHYLCLVFFLSLVSISISLTLIAL
jgi:hypothetical protein